VSVFDALHAKASPSKIIIESTELSFAISRRQAPIALLARFHFSNA
jgi:hypothetical protein